MSVIPDKSTHNRPKKQLYISIAFQKEMQRFKRFKDPKDKLIHQSLLWETSEFIRVDPQTLI